MRGGMGMLIIFYLIGAIAIATGGLVGGLYLHLSIWQSLGLIFGAEVLMQIPLLAYVVFASRRWDSRPAPQVVSHHG